MLTRLKHAVSQLASLNDTPECIACGLGIGMGLGVSPFWGLLTPVCVFFCWLLRGSQVAGMLAMWAIAPLFYVVIFPLEIWAGSLILGSAPAYEIVGQLMSSRDWSQLLTLGKGWIIGFFPVGTAFGLLSWGVSLWLLRRWRAVHPVPEPEIDADEDESEMDGDD